MSEKPMLFSGDMVRAILDGRKTQTRRILKFPRWSHPKDKGEDLEGDLSVGFNPMICHKDTGCLCDVPCPYGQIGSCLWVKETHARIHEGLLQHLDPEPDNGQKFNNGWTTVFRADGEPAHWKHYGLNWKPSIFMRREYSRINLEITAVRVERLQDISEEDSIAEGIHRISHGMNGDYFHAFNTEYSADNFCYASTAYKELWESINGNGSWKLNPWVWVIEFKKL